MLKWEVNRAHVKALMQRHVGSAPILNALIQKMGVIEIIDRTSPLPVRRKGPTHGEAVAALVVALTQGIGQWSRVEPCATEGDVLSTLFPHSPPKVGHDDHVGETLEAIWASGIGALQGAVTTHLVQSVRVGVDQRHDETTSFKVSGASREDKEARDHPEDKAVKDRAEDKEPLRVTCGQSKDHRPDVKQVKGGLCASADGGVVLLVEGQDGNQADVSPSVDSWLKLKAVVGRADFLCIGECTLATHDTMIAIMRQGGRFLAPGPRDAEAQQQLEEWGLTNTVEERLSRRDAQGREVWYRGVQREQVLVDEPGQESPGCMHVLCSPRRHAEKQATVERRVAKTHTCLADLPQTLGTRRWQSQEAMEQAIEATLMRNQTRACVSDRVSGTTETLQRDQGRGRPSPPTPAEEVTRLRWQVE